MEHKPVDEQNSEIEVTNSDKRTKMPLSAVALMFSVIPFLLFLPNRNIFLLFFISIFPFIGFILGIFALCESKNRVDKFNKILSIGAVVFPIAFALIVMMLDSLGALTFSM